LKIFECLVCSQAHSLGPSAICTCYC